MFCLTATHLKSKILAENWLLSQKPSGPLCLVHAKLNTETFCCTETEAAPETVLKMRGGVVNNYIM